jgi:hypothetical protein
MVYNTNITLITTNTTLSTKDDVYIVNASGGSLTITLPLITANGMQYKIKRSDTTPTSTVTIIGTSGQTIDGAVSILLATTTNIELQSLNSVWFVVGYSVANLAESKSLFTSAFVQNNGSAFITFSGTGTPALVCSFYYPGSIIAAIFKVTAVLAINGGTPTGSYEIRTQAGATICSSTYTGTITLTPQAFSTTTISNLPSGPSVLEFLIIVNTPNSSKVNIYSLTIQ